MKNLMSRDEYLDQMNEGVIRDTVRKGLEKIKSIFNIGMKKIKDFIAVFDNRGHVLPVVTPQAVIDRFSDNDSIKVYSSADMDQSCKAAGGAGCETGNAPVKEDEPYDFGPKGKEFAKWMLDGKYKDTVEYQNLMSVPGIIQECYECSSEEAKELFEGMLEEDWEDTKRDRVSYTNAPGEALSELDTITSSDFEDILNKMINDMIVNGGKVIKRSDGKTKKPWGNVLIFGAPGIGKSTVPNLIVNKFNADAKTPAGQISLITVDCPNIAVGDFMMPTMPQPKMVLDMIEKNPEAFPEAAGFVKDLSPEQQSSLEKSLAATKQFEAHSAPKAWLPSYRKTGDDDLDSLLNTYANGGVYTDEEEHTHKTGNGGIIMFDEFLRTDPNVFKQLMIFLLTREMEGWTLGSKWIIIACSNRPCDDQEVDNVWKKWNGGPAAKDRFQRMFHLEPTPREWQAWAKGKGCDQLLLDFIFDKNTKVENDEYPRWHSMVKNSAKGGQILPISPRRWQTAFEAINSFEIDNDLSDISQMSIHDVRGVLKGIFDKSFIVEITNWLEDNMNKVDLDEIIKDPEHTYLPKKFSGKDAAMAATLIKNLWSQFEDKFKDSPEECTDDVLANIFIWLGINYPHSFNEVYTAFINELDTVLPNNSEHRYSSKVKAFQMMYSAWPLKGLENSVKNMEADSVDPWPKGSLETMKGYMTKYFPWNIDGDRIKYYDDLEKGNQ